MRMKKSTLVKFEHFLEKFPEVDLPVTLSEDIHLEFSRLNDPLPQAMIEQYLNEAGDIVVDEFTEFVPCFSLKKTENFHAIVYWIGALLDYQYVMMTFDKTGNRISHHVIAGTKLIDNALLRSVATIDEEWIIYVVAGMADAKTNQFEANASQSFHFELLATGEIIKSE